MVDKYAIWIYNNYGNPTKEVGIAKTKLKLVKKQAKKEEKL